METPHPAVVDAFARKAKRLSQDVEMMARYGREWLPDDNLLTALWTAQRELYQIYRALSQKKSN